MRLPVYVVDAFASKPFEGNPAAVVTLREELDAGLMQNIAAEMNHAETAFVLLRAGGFGLRWFTPTVEVDLCGHATLASAHVLWETGMVPRSEPLRFETRSGTLSARSEEDGICLDFPAEPAKEVEPPPMVKAYFHRRLKWMGQNRFDLLLVLEDECAVREFEPDFDAIATLGGRGVILTAPASEFDFVSRFFAPCAGVNEDPVTGSAHCCLGPYWGAKLGKDDMVGYQASARGGRVRVRLRGERVDLVGTAVTVLRGEIEC